SIVTYCEREPQEEDRPLGAQGARAHPRVPGWMVPTGCGVARVCWTVLENEPPLTETDREPGR
ncbi:hypothetical protein NDU88_008218, partial [Pleurodeles waltl]